MKVADADLGLYGRRYSAVAFSHPSLRKISDLYSALGTIAPIGDPVNHGPGIISQAVHLQYFRDLYPNGSVLRGNVELDPESSLGTDTIFTHWCYLASLTDSSAKSPMFVFCSPYVRIVQAWTEALQGSHPSPRLLYRAPDLSKLFDSLATEGGSLSATQIILQMSGIVGVKRVALTGASPLISSLRRELGTKARPYGVRLEAPRSEFRPLRFHADRHGNLWWYQINPNALTVALRVLATIRDRGFLVGTHDSPLLRLEVAQDVELESSDA